jgi:hypothetical protein
MKFVTLFFSACSVLISSTTLTMATPLSPAFYYVRLVTPNLNIYLTDGKTSVSAVDALLPADLSARVGVTGVEATLSTGCGSGQCTSGAVAYNQYYFEIVGPSNPNVPVIVTGGGFVTGALAEVGASLSINGVELCASCQLNEGRSFDASGLYYFPANKPIVVSMEAEVSIIGNTHPGIYGAVVDPTFAINPSFAAASQYSIIYSPGLPTSVTPYLLLGP